MKFDCCSSFHSVFAVVMAATSQVGVLMKLDKNQRKPRAFKASDLCPYYNRRVRFCEYRGKNAEITFSFGGSEHRLSFSPFEIRTLKLENGALSEIYMTEDGPLL